MAKKLTEKILREEETKLVDAYVDKNGKFLIKESYPYSDADKGMFYIASKNLKLPPQNRLVSDFAKKLIDEGKAVLIRKDEWESLKKSIKL